MTKNRSKNRTFYYKIKKDNQNLHQNEWHYGQDQDQNSYLPQNQKSINRNKKSQYQKYQKRQKRQSNKNQNQNRQMYKRVIAILTLTFLCLFSLVYLQGKHKQQIQKEIRQFQQQSFLDLNINKEPHRQKSSNIEIETNFLDEFQTYESKKKSQKSMEKDKSQDVSNFEGAVSEKLAATKNDNQILSQKNQKKQENFQINRQEKQDYHQVNNQRRYVYGDPIDFTKIQKRNRNIARTNLSPDNLDKAAQFYNLLGKDVENDPALKQIADMEIRYYDEKYQITQFQEQIQICVFILSYNNEPQNRYKANLDSVFQQNYENYFVVYVNDVSSDRTGELVQEYMNQNPIAKQKMTLINNQIRKRKSRNQYELAHQYCKPGAIMFPFDGDDCIIGRQAFKLLNAIYQQKQALFVYLNFLQFHKQSPSKFLLQSGYSREVSAINKRNRNYRRDGVPLHMRTWISDIFLSISQEDYKMNGQFVNVGEDVMVMYSLQQLAGQKGFYIPQIVYAYNQDTGINDSSDQKNLEQRKNVQQYAKSQKKLQLYDKKVQYRLKMPKKYFKLP